MINYFLKINKLSLLIMSLFCSFVGTNARSANTEELNSMYDSTLVALFNDLIVCANISRDFENQLDTVLSYEVSVMVDSLAFTEGGVLNEFVDTHVYSYLKSNFNSVEIIKRQPGDNDFSGLNVLYELTGFKAFSYVNSEIEACEKSINELKEKVKARQESENQSKEDEVSRLDKEIQSGIHEIEDSLSLIHTHLAKVFQKESSDFITHFKTYLISCDNVAKANNVRTSVVEEMSWTYTILNETEKTCEVGAVYNLTDGTGWFIERKSAIERTTAGAVVIPPVIDGYTVVGLKSGAFNGCNEMTSLVVPGTVMKLGENVFQCEKLATVELCEGITEIPVQCFYNCTNLHNVNIPSTVKVIQGAAFSKCTNLETINIPVGVVKICNGAFYDSGIKEVIIPRGCEEIEYGAFDGCIKLERLFISKDVKKIGDFASHPHWYPTFANTPSLSSIVVEDGNEVFDSRNNCNAIIYSETNELIQGCKTTRIPSDVEIIDAGAFEGQSEMETITIPASVKSIAGNSYGETYNTSLRVGAFHDCRGLKSIFSLIADPFPINDVVFGSARSNSSEEEKKVIYKNATLFVPVGSREKYLAMSAWNLFENIVEFDPTKVKGLKFATNIKNVFDLLGHKVSKLQKGIILVQDSMGDVRKIMVK